MHDTTELQRELSGARAALAQSRQQVHQLASILDHMPAMVGYWDTSLINCFANQAYMEWLGKRPGEIAGRHIREVLGEALYALNLPFIEKALAGQVQRFERVIPNPVSGLQRASQADYIPDLKDGVVRGFFVLVVDISEQKEAQDMLRYKKQQLRESEHRYRTVVMDQTEIISRLRADGRYLFANEVFCRFFGKQLDELTHSNWTPLVHPDDVRRVQEAMSALSPDHPVIMVENRVMDAKGNCHWMQFSNRGLFSPAGELLEIQSVGRDVSERKQAEAELQRLNQALQDSQTLLRDMAARNESRVEGERKHFARELHDELGQLLTALRMDLLFLELKYCGLDDGLRDKVMEMKAMLDQAFAAARNVASILRPTVLDMGLDAALRWLCSEFQRKSGVPCSYGAEPATGAIDEKTSMVLFRIVQESLTNIARHAGAAKVEVQLLHRCGTLQVSVRDDGRGFVREAQSEGKRFGLLGMQERALALGGQLDIRSSPGAGTCVSVSIPWPPPAAESP